MYKEIKEINFTDKQDQAIELLARKEVESYSMQEIADIIGVSRQALYDWNKMPHFKRAVNKRSLQALTDYAPKVLYNTSQFLESKNETVKLKGVELVMKAVESQDKIEREEKEREKETDVEKFLLSLEMPSPEDITGWIAYYEKEIEENTKKLNEYKEELYKQGAKTL